MWYAIVFLLGVFLGYVIAHREVATESERLGAFYGGKKVYYVTKIEEMCNENV